MDKKLWDSNKIRFKKYSNYIIAFLFVCSIYILSAKIFGFLIYHHSFINGIVFIAIISGTYIISLLCNNKIAKILIIIFSAICIIGIIYYYVGEFIFIKKDYEKKYEYVDAMVLQKETSNRGKFRVYVKCKLVDEDKFIIVYNEPMTTSVGDKVRLVKITYHKENSIIRDFTVYKPSNYPIKRFVRKNENILLYQDLINNTEIEFNVSDFKNENINFSKRYTRKPYSVNFVVLTDKEFKNYLLNFTENLQTSNTNIYHGTKLTKEIQEGTFYLYNEPYCSYGIVKYKENNNYLVVSIPFNIFEIYHALNIENLEEEYNKILNIK